MSARHFVLDSRGEHRDLDAFVVAAAWIGDAPAFALGDGRLVLAGWRDVAAHDGAILSLAASADAFVTGGDDGAFRRTTLAGDAETVAKFGLKWVEQVAAHGTPDACAVGKTVHLYDGGTKLKQLDHPSSVTGLAFDAKGKRIAASHYNGATLWFVGAKVDSPRRLEWKGSHTGIAIHPAGEAVVTSMQENALHGWRLADGQHMRMSGYPSKTESLGFTRNGKWLATAGPTRSCCGRSSAAARWARRRPRWPAATTCCAPASRRIRSTRWSPPGSPTGWWCWPTSRPNASCRSRRRAGARISALAWSADGARLALGTETGFAALVDLSKR